MQNRSEFVFGTIASFAVNGLGVLWALGWLAFGALGVGLSSSPTNELQQIWNSFVCMAACLPILGIIGLISGVLIRRQKQFALGALFGLVLALLVGGCLVAMIAGYLMFLSRYPGGIGIAPHWRI